MELLNKGAITTKPIPSPFTDKYLSSGILVTLKDGEVENLSAGTYLKFFISNGENVYVNVSNLVIGVGSITNEKISNGTISRNKIDKEFEKSITALELKLAGNDNSVVEQIAEAINQCNSYTDDSLGWIQL